MKRLLMMVPVLAMAVGVLAPAATAQVDADPSTDCLIDHVTAPATGPCQGPDIESAPDKCDLEVWVEEGTCLLSPSGGTSSRVSVHGSWAWSEPRPTDQQWRAELSIEVIDTSTGDTVFSTSSVETEPITSFFGPINRNQLFGASTRGTFDASPGPFLCVATGTHSPLGVAPADANWGSIPGVPVTGMNPVHNRLRCSIG